MGVISEALVKHPTEGQLVCTARNGKVYKYLRPKHQGPFCGTHIVCNRVGNQVEITGYTLYDANALKAYYLKMANRYATMITDFAPVG